MEMLSKTEKIVDQYCGAVGVLDQMFKDMDLRSEIEDWRVNGVGSCVYVMSKKSSELDFKGCAKTHLIKLREQRNSEVKGISNLSNCPYHREDFGCTLGNLKSPLCIGYIENYQTLKKVFRIDGCQLYEDISWILEVILLQDGEWIKCYFPKPYPTIEEFYLLILDAIKQMNDHVVTFPILQTDEREILKVKQMSLSLC